MMAGGTNQKPVRKQIDPASPIIIFGGVNSPHNKLANLSGLENTGEFGHQLQTFAAQGV